MNRNRFAHILSLSIAFILMAAGSVRAEEEITPQGLNVWGNGMVLLLRNKNSVAGALYHGPGGKSDTVLINTFHGFNSSVPALGGKVLLGGEPSGQLSILVGPGNCEKQLENEIASLKGESAPFVPSLKNTKAILMFYNVLPNGVNALTYGQYFVEKYSSENGVTLLGSQHEEFGPNNETIGFRWRSYTQLLSERDAPDLTFSAGRKGLVYRRKKGQDYSASAGECFHAEVKSVNGTGLTHDLWAALVLEGPLVLFREMSHDKKILIETVETQNGALKYVFQNEGNKPLLVLFDKSQKSATKKIATLPKGTKVMLFDEFPLNERGKFLWSLPSVAPQGPIGLYLKIFELNRSFEKTKTESLSKEEFR